MFQLILKNNSLRIKQSHFDFEYLDLELNSEENKIQVNLYNSDNIHPNWLMDNQLDSIMRQIDKFYQNHKGLIKKEFEILINIIKDGRESYMMGFLKIS